MSAPYSAKDIAVPLWRIGDYRRGWLLGLFTGISRWLEYLALGIFAYELTKSPPLVALLAIVRIAPYALFGFWIGTLTDTINRKRWYLIGLLVMATVACAMTYLAFYGQATYASVVLATLVAGIFWVTDMPFRRRFMLDAVEASRIGRAMGFDNITNFLTRGLGPLLGGFTYEWFGAAGIFALSFALYVLCFLTAYGLSEQSAGPSSPTTKTPSPETALPMREHRPSRRGNLLSSPLFLAVLGVTLIYNLFCLPFLTMLPVFAQKDFGFSPSSVGFLAAFEGVGGLVGSVALGLWLRDRGLFALYFTGPLLFLLSIVSLSFWLTAPMTIAALLVVGLGGACFTGTQYALIYTTADASLRGRAFGFVSLCIGTATIGLWNAGYLFDHYSSATALTIMAIEGLVPMAVILGYVLIRRVGWG